MNVSTSPRRAADWPAVRVSRWPHVLLGLTLVLVVGTAIAIASWIESREDARIGREVARTEGGIVRRMAVYVAQLRAAAALFDAAGEGVDRERFRRFTRRLELDAEYPGIQGLGWVQRIDDGQEAARIVSEARADGFPEFHIRPESTEDQRFAIVFLEPLDSRNRVALGLDMYADPVRRAAMARARDTGAPALSGSVRLVQEIAGPVQPGFLIYVPVYRGGAVPETVEERRETLVGFAYAPFRARDLFDAILGERLDVEVEVFDGESLDERDRLYGVAPPEDARSEVVVREIAGHPWTLRITRRHNGVATSLGAAIVIGLLGTLFALGTHRVALRESDARLRAEQGLLREAREAQVRELFLGVLGHDLRNPLQAILMTSRMLLGRERPGDEAEQRALERIVSSTLRASRMVSQLLDMTRARVGEGLSIQHAAVDVALLTRDAVGELRAAHPERAIEVDVDEGDELLRVQGDPDRLAQVLGNLGSNAVVHGNPGQPVRFRAHRRNGEVVVEVWNAGPPIPSDGVPFLFDPFARTHSARGGKREGLGLGLYISDQIARAHGGRLELVENDAHGVTFALSLPS